MTIPHEIVVTRMDASGAVVLYQRVEYDYGYLCGRGTAQEKANAHALARLDDWLRTPGTYHPPGVYRLHAYRLTDDLRGPATEADRVRLVASVSIRHGRTKRT